MIYSTAHEYPDTFREKNTVENGLCDTVYVYWKIQEKAVLHRGRQCNSVATLSLRGYRYLRH